VDDQFLNGIGVVMGGFLTSAADIVMACAIATKLDEQQSFASIHIHTTFHRPVKAGHVLVSAKVERIGKKVAYLVAELVQNEKKVASAVSFVIILEN
jgi:acyl-CoA thioesterase